MAAPHPLRDGDPAYEPYIILKAQRWTVYLNPNDQAYLGRSYVWLTSRHVDNMALDELFYHERQDLFVLMERFRKALGALGWKPERINSCWLGNETQVHRGHGHMHLIPRYIESPRFLNRTFVDFNVRANYTPHERLRLPDAQLFKIRDAIKEAWPRK